MAVSQSETAASYPGTLPQRQRPIYGYWDRLMADRALLRRVLMIGGVALVALVLSAYWLMSGRYVSTDDSYVHAAQLTVSTDVSGLVSEVDVKEGQHVKKGQVLFRIDPRQFQIALNNAQANLGQVRLTVLAMRDDYQRMLRDIAAQESQVRLDQVTYDRYAALMRANSIAQQTVDQARFALASAQSSLGALKDTAQVQLAKLGGKLDLPIESLPQFQAAQGQVEEAQRQLDHTVVRAPFDGTVTAVDSLQPGTLVISALSSFSTTSAVGLVSDRDVWVEANLKETDLTHVHLGDPVDVQVDTYPDRTWHGRVEAISPATGSAFSVLPSENASGNWVKITQRLSVKLKLDMKPSDPPLRLGMSTYVTIDTGHGLWYRLLFGH
jgi:membrane fusion protein (multidrug efflux system)